MMKYGSNWGYRVLPTLPAPQVPIVELDPNGYVTSIVSGTTGVVSNITSFPTLAEYNGQWVLDWDGTGTLAIFGRTVTTVSGSLSSGPYTFTINADSTSAFTIGVTATSASPNHVRNIRLYKVGNQALLNAGQPFDLDTLTIVRSANPGVIRSLGAGGGTGNGTNDSNIATWSQRKPKTYFSWVAVQSNPAIYAGRTTSSGSDYTVSFPSFALSNKVAVAVMFDVKAPQTGSTNISWSTTNTVAININWPTHGLAAGNTVAFGNNSSPPSAIVAGQLYFINNVIDANNFTISATSGGASVVATATTSGTMVGASIPRINVNSTGFVPITGQQTITPANVFAGFTAFAPAANTVSTLVYDSTIGYFYLQSQPGINNGFPPEIFIDYCAAVGAHPHLVTPFLAIEPVTDFMTSWASYATSNYSWMKPRVEPPNETWNNAAAFFGTFYANSLAYVLWGAADFNQAYGKWCSTLGQAISAVYGNDRTKYSMICSFQRPGTSVGTQSKRINSDNYVSVNGGSPAYLWVDRLCCDGYMSAAYVNTIQELLGAYNYCVVHAGNSASQAADLNTYIATCSGNAGPPYPFGTVEDCVVNQKTLQTFAGTLTAGNTVKGGTAYEGGYAVNYPMLQRSSPLDWSTNISAATKANPCVLTLAANSQNCEFSSTGQITGNPAVVGMMLSIASVAGMTQLNCATGTAAFSTGSANITLTIGTMPIVGQQVAFNTNTYSNSSIRDVLKVAPTPLVAGQPYWVVSVVGSVIQVSATKGGSAITITDASVLSSAINTGWSITNVAGTSITIDVDSTGFSTYTSGGAGSYNNSYAYTNTFRLNTIQATGLGAQNTIYNNQLAAISTGSYFFEYPSNFLYTNAQSGWAVLNPDYFAPLSSQWNSIVAYNH